MFFLCILGLSLVPMAQVAAHNGDHDPNLDCSKELILAFFPEEFVKVTLKKYNVPQDQWSAITKELAAKDKGIITAVEDKAAKMNPNPLKDATKQADAVKIFRETLFDNFASVLRSHGVNDDKKIQEMLDDVQAQKAKRFSECFPQPSGETAPAK